MLAKRLLLLSTFAGGCLSGAAVIGLWPSAPEIVPAPVKQRLARPSAPVAAPTATPPAVPEADIEEDVTSGDVPDDTADAPMDSGSSVADVLAALEAAYRQGVADGAKAHAKASTDPVSATTTHADPQSTGVDVPAPVPTHITVTAIAAAPAPLPAPPADEKPIAVAARDDSEPKNVTLNLGDSNTHVGDVYEGNVHRGDVYVVQPPAVYGYFPYYPAPRANHPSNPAQPAYPPRGTMAPKSPTFASSWTVPNARLTYDEGLIPMLK